MFPTISTKLTPEENLGHLAMFLHLLQHKLWGSLGKLSTSFQRKGAFPGGRLPSCVLKTLTSVMPLPGNPFAWGTDCMLRGLSCVCAGASTGDDTTRSLSQVRLGSATLLSASHSLEGGRKTWGAGRNASSHVALAEVLSSEDQSSVLHK